MTKFNIIVGFIQVLSCDWRINRIILSVILMFVFLSLSPLAYQNISNIHIFIKIKMMHSAFIHVSEVVHMKVVCVIACAVFLFVAFPPERSWRLLLLLDLSFFRTPFYGGSEGFVRALEDNGLMFLRVPVIALRLFKTISHRLEIFTRFLKARRRLWGFWSVFQMNLNVQRVYDLKERSCCSSKGVKVSCDLSQ